MIDTHCHIDVAEFDKDRTEVINRAFNDGVKALIIPAIEPKYFDRVVNVADSYSNVFFGIGIHPHNATDATKENLELVKSYAKEKSAVAIGEIGLDYYYDFAPRETQIQAFENQLKIAKELNLPVIIHNRKADEDIISILSKKEYQGLTGVLHCFSGSTETLEKALSLGYYISFTGNITFKKSNILEQLNKTPMERLLLETDAPYMAPVPYRGKRNEPAFLRFTTEKISEIKSISINEVISMTTKNAKKLFNLLLFLIFFLITFSPISAQPQEEEIEEARFPKFLGIGPLFGTNTIVETYYKGGIDEDISYEGIFGIGGNLYYGITNFALLNLSYIYSKNTKIQDDTAGVGPNIYQVIDLSALWIPNPNSVISIYGITGISYVYNIISQKTRLEQKHNKFALNTGLGFLVNIDLGSVGLFNFCAEWRLNFLLGKSRTLYYEKYVPGKPEESIVKEADVSTFFSIPRVIIVWYPAFFK